MRINVLGLYHETNTFAPDRTELNDFSNEWVEGNVSFNERYTNTRTSMGGVIDVLNAHNVELIAGLYASAMPSGMVTGSTADKLLTQLVDSIDVTTDGIIVILHGAMVSEQYSDLEGELLQRIREQVGREIPVAITIDLHACITPLMMNHIQIVVGYDTYPHVDAYERAVEATSLLIRTINKEIQPVHRLVHPRMVIVPQVMQTNRAGAYREIMERAFELESIPGVLAVTVVGGFPYSDVPHMGMGFVVVTDNNDELAILCAKLLSDMAWELRESLQHQDMPVDEAVVMAMDRMEGPIVLIEGSDNVGGGAPGDATHTLKLLIDAPKKCLIVIRDEDAARKAHQMQIGERFEASIGGHSSPLHGEPIPISGVVRQLSEGHYRHVGKYMTGQWAYMGKAAVIQADKLTIVLTEKRVAPWDPGHITSLGLQAEDYHIIVVKSAIAWQTAFGEVCRESVAIDTPGCCSANLHHFTYKLLNRPIYPIDYLLN